MSRLTETVTHPAAARPEPTPALGIIPRRRTNVLYIIDQLCEMGGAERVLLNIIRLLPRDRFRPHLLTFKIDRSLGIFDAMPCSWNLFPLKRTWDANAVRVAWQINRLVRREHIEIVHTFFETSDIWAGPIARLSGSPVLISSRRDMGILRAPKHRLAYRAANHFYTQIQTVSEQVRRYCIEHDHLNPKRVLTLYNGVDLGRAALAHPGSHTLVPSLAGATHTIVTVAHIRQVKGIDVLLRAAARVRAEFPNAHWVVVGDNHQPAHYDALLRLQAELELSDRVHFSGAIEDIFGLLCASDVFCLPSRSEGLSNALLEAMACSLPCVATNVGGNPELIEHGHNGLLIEKEDDRALAETIIGLLRDPASARRMGSAARRLVEERFSTEVMMRHLVRSYELALDKHFT
jgi:glycosyltransferase involved in cell wall biosynthesis